MVCCCTYHLAINATRYTVQPGAKVPFYKRRLGMHGANKVVRLLKSVCGIGACALVMTSVSVALAQQLNNQWTMGGQNLNNGRNQKITEINQGNVKQLKVKWTFTTGGDVTATPAVSNGVVYFPDWGGNFYAVNATTGAQIWKRLVGDWTGIPGDLARDDPAIENDTLFLGNQAGSNAFWNGSSWVGGGAWVAAVDAKTGNLKWSTKVEAFAGAIVSSSP